MFKTNSRVLAKACKGTCGRSYFDTIVSDCIDLFQLFDDVLVVFTRSNIVAHLLAGPVLQVPRP